MVIVSYDGIILDYIKTTIHYLIKIHEFLEEVREGKRGSSEYGTTSILDIEEWKIIKRYIALSLIALYRASKAIQKEEKIESQMVGLVNQYVLVGQYLENKDIKGIDVMFRKSRMEIKSQKQHKENLAKALKRVIEHLQSWARHLYECFSLKGRPEGMPVRGARGQADPFFNQYLFQEYHGLNSLTQYLAWMLKEMGYEVEKDKEIEKNLLNVMIKLRKMEKFFKVDHGEFTPSFFKEIKTKEFFIEKLAKLEQ
ncbi:hypothetical protein KY306_00805 [Candidatus Woesearchaeota archaeon]|nr:hypothetical protein [Candidatus Woesearchaeota archaeon]